MERSLQHRIWDWAVYAFGADRAASVRGFRFTEEALELAQAVGVTKDEALQLVDYVYSRPKGTVREEIGGVMITFNNLATAENVNTLEQGEEELLRVWQKVEKLRAKEAAAKARGDRSPLPGNIDSKD